MSCLSHEIKTKIKVMDVLGERVESIRSNTNGQAEVRCAGFFREAREEEYIILAGTKNWDGRYLVKKIESRSTRQGDKGNEIKRGNISVASVLTLEGEFENSEEIYDGSQGGNPIIYLERGAKEEFTLDVDFKDNRIDQWRSQREELQIKESHKFIANNDTEKKIRSFSLHNELPAVSINALKWNYTSIGDSTVAENDGVPSQFVDDDPSVQEQWEFNSIAFKPETVLYINDVTGTVISGPERLFITIKQKYSGFSDFVFGTSKTVAFEGQVTKGSNDLEFIQNLRDYVNAIIPKTVIEEAIVITGDDVGVDHIPTGTAELVFKLTFPGSHTTLDIDIIDLSTGETVIDGKETAEGKSVSLYNQYPDDSFYQANSPNSSQGSVGRWWGRISDELLYPALNFAPGGSINSGMFGLREIGVQVTRSGIGSLLNSNIESIGTIQLLTGSREN